MGVNFGLTLVQDSPALRCSRILHIQERAEDHKGVATLSDMLLIPDAWMKGASCVDVGTLRGCCLSVGERVSMNLKATNLSLLK